MLLHCSNTKAGLAILLVFLQYSFDKGIKDGLLLCKSLELCSTGNDIFNVTDNFINHMISVGKNAFSFAVMEQSQ